MKNLIHLELTDESDQHSGRKGQESHFKLVIVSDDFKNQSKVQRQRFIQDCLRDEFITGLHALTMRLLTAEEYNKQQNPLQSPACAGGAKKAKMDH